MKSRTASPVAVRLSGQTPTVPSSDDSVVVSISTSQPKSVEERLYLRWSTDMFVSSHMIEASGSEQNYAATIPWNWCAILRGNLHRGSHSGRIFRGNRLFNASDQQRLALCVGGQSERYRTVSFENAHGGATCATSSTSGIIPCN